ncbi:MAG: hypothetical protein PWP75_111 [Caldanaerobacter sp.]|nr:hypothetical protein [Caldanaerobacter sp.]
MDLKSFFNLLLGNTPFAVFGRGTTNVSVGVKTGIAESAKWRPKWKIEKYDAHGRLYAVEEFAGNMLLAEGITEMWKLIAGASSAHFDSANSYIGVGNGTTAATASQTGLQGSSKLYKPVDPTYPQISNQTITFRATFGSNEAVWSWDEYTVCNSNSDSGINLCRKVENHGVKGSEDTWVIYLSISLS